MSKTFLIVFHGQINNGKIVDIGDDPCFNSPPSWGICRPQTRQAVNSGDTLIFIAKVDTDYFLKGWFQVAGKLDYPSALHLFPNRHNVIISTTPSNHPIEWRYRERKKKYLNEYGQGRPNFLLDLQTETETFYQSSTDEHEIDNWKCSRILHCNKNQFANCVIKNSCLKNGVSLKDKKYKNYVVADANGWEDLDSLRSTFDEIAIATNFKKAIRTPKGQHNVLRFDDHKEKFFTFIENKKNNGKLIDERLKNK